jgi:hypothetical protein
VKYLKAFTGAIVTGLGTLQVAYGDGLVTTQEWIGVAIATLVAFGAVWAVPNKQPVQAPPSDGSSMGAL